MDDQFITPVHPLDQMETTAPPQKAPLSQSPRSPDFHVLPEIDNTNRNFKGQQKNEVVHSFCRKHWIVLVPHLIGFLCIVVFPMLFLLFIPQDALSALMSPFAYRIIAGITLVGITYYFHLFFLRFFAYYLQIMIITNFRVIQLDQTLFFSRNRDSIDLPEIQDIVIQQKGVIKTILNYGELTITLSSAHSSKKLTCVPNPEYFFRKINKTKREYITSRRILKGNDMMRP